jgi:hypothetical protein
MLRVQSVVLLTAVVTLAYSLPTAVSAQSDKNFCYDQIGDPQFCFDAKKKCENQRKDDRIAESPCYHKSQE